MIGNKHGEVLKISNSEKKRSEADGGSLAESKPKLSSENIKGENNSFTPKFCQNDYLSLFDKSVNDLFLNVEENVELNAILSKIIRKSPKNGTQKLHEKLELNFKNSLKKNLGQRQSIRRFMFILFNDLLSLAHDKEVL